MNDRVEIAHEFAKAMKSKYVKKMILFGSVARGDDKKDSSLKYMHEDKFNYKIYKYFVMPNQTEKMRIIMLLMEIIRN